jgi:hypothetical protein
VGSPQQPKSGSHSVVFISVVVAIVLGFGLASTVPTSSVASGQQVLLASAGSPGTVLVQGFASMRGNWIAAAVIFTNSTGSLYYASIGGDGYNYDPQAGGTYSIQLQANSTYTVQIQGQLLGQLMTCAAGTLTLQGSRTSVRQNYRC